MTTGSEPATIDEIIARLNRILDDASREGARIGYFVALYERVTTNVRRALVAGKVFEDGDRIERLGSSRCRKPSRRRGVPASATAHPGAPHVEPSAFPTHAHAGALRGR